MRWLPTLLLICGSCGGPVTPQVGLANPNRVGSAETARATPLPAGLWFAVDHYERAAVPEGLPPPGAAVIAGVFSERAAAARAVQQSEGLAPGYPWVVHTDGLGPSDEALEGIAVVLGLFETRAQAARSGGQVITLAEPELAWRRASQRARGDAEPTTRSAFALDGEGEIRAYSEASLIALEPMYGTRRFDSLSAAAERLRAGLTSLHPRCTLRPGDVVTIADAGSLSRFGRTMVPVTCDGGGRAFVLRERTRIESVVVRSAEGAVELHQVVDVSCDMASFDVWRLDGERRYDRDGSSAGGGGC